MSDRLISADKFKAYMQDKYLLFDHTLEDIDAQPTVDAEPVVRCKDCTYQYYDGNQIICQRLYFCDGSNFEPSAEDFCSHGERKEDGKID